MFPVLRSWAMASCTRPDVCIESSWVKTSKSVPNSCSDFLMWVNIKSTPISRKTSDLSGSISVSASGRWVMTCLAISAM
ncbi:Uncharacterised protein [Mycobacteroides abscessus subsp. abscessus]|nr:Uncharacterised protein [Mycobacteroides abscessus subsp. abscessus]SIN55141.1 Uncharacterised protein [Mycobacteroides abscessus subsp. abscessus]